MAIGSPFHERSWSPAGGLPHATPVARDERWSAPGAPSEGALDLRLVRAAIQDGLLMVFGPDDDPVPPQVFGAVAAEQPDADVRLADGSPVRAERIAAVLQAQMNGHLAHHQHGGEAWIRAMLGIGPQPEMADDDRLVVEDCTVEVVAFGRELMITSPDGATFLLADARSRAPDSISLRMAGGGPVALGDLVARLLAGAGEDHADPDCNEFAAPACRAWLEGGALRIELPGVGVIDLAGAGEDAPAAPSLSLFMASGEVATIGDLLSALSTPVAAPPASGHADPLDPPAPPFAADAHVSREVPVAIGLPHVLAAAPDLVALLVVRGLPAGASLSAGVEGGDGSWLLSPRDLAALSVTPPSDCAADLVLEVAAIAVANPEGELTSAAETISVPLRPAAAQPSMSPLSAPAPSPVLEPVPSPVAEPARASVPLDLDPQALSDGGAFDAVIVRDLPAGVTLSAGIYDPAIAGWVLLPHQLSNLSLLVAGGPGAEFTLSLLGVCLRPGAGARPRELARVPVTIH